MRRALNNYVEAVYVWILVIRLLRLYIFEKKKKKKKAKASLPRHDTPGFFSYLLVVYVRLQIQGFFFFFFGL